MGMTVGNGDGLQAEINVTPLVDVVLVLLIIFMVIIPLSMRGYDVAIPGEATEAPPPEKETEQIVLVIDPSGCPVIEPPAAKGLPSNCHVQVNEELLPVAKLAQRMTELFAGRERSERVLFLAANGRLNYEGVMRILDLAKSGVDGLRIGFVTEAKPAASGA
jgi:biopolymer transport protein ExbD